MLIDLLTFLHSTLPDLLDLCRKDGIENISCIYALGNLAIQLVHLCFVTRYFKMISNIQGLLHHWSDKFRGNDITYEDICYFRLTDTKKWLTQLGKSVVKSSLSNYILNSSDDKLTKFLEQYEMLNIRLLCYIPGSSVCRPLPDLLYVYNLVLPPSIVDKVTFPKSLLSSSKYHAHVTSINPSTSGDFKPGIDIKLVIDKSMTLKELINIIENLNIFEEPFVVLKNMFLFFTLNDSILFEKKLLNYLKNYPPEDPLSAFANALQNMYDFLEEILRGEEKNYSEIVVEVKQLDLEKEFVTLREYAVRVRNCKTDDLKGLDDIENAMELVQYATHIKHIEFVCQKYLRSCLNDSQLKELIEIVKDHESNWSKMTPREATEKMSKIRRILFLGDRASSKCLKVFSAVKESDEFYRFVTEKQFYGKQGIARFQQQYELITAQLQHEEYNEHVLNHLFAAFKVISPFVDAKRSSFSELMKEVRALNVTSGLMQLETVNRNITLIRLWFSRAEVITVVLLVNTVYKL